MSEIVTDGIGKEGLEAGVCMSVPKEQSLLVLIKRDQPGEDWLYTREVMQEASVRVAPLPGSAR